MPRGSRRRPGRCWPPTAWPVSPPTPPRCPLPGTGGAGEPGGWDGLRYWRLHGSPVIYRSAYGPAVLDALAARFLAEAVERPVWCVFDNTADFHAVDDALALTARLGDAAARP